MASGPAADGAEPTVVVDDLHVVYRVYGAGGDKGTAATALMRVIKRQRRPSVREVHAIRGISFVINHGDAVGIIGRNGSGKSTLLQAIAGLLPPEQGCVYTSGQAALLGVNAALLDDLTGERNVVLGCLAMGMTPQETKDRYQSIVDFSGVGNFIDYPMRTYSTGMAQRLRFSIASAKNHEILMIDEALATGDANFRAKSHERIVAAARGGGHRIPRRAQPGRDRGELQPGDLAGEGPDHAAGLRRARDHRRLPGSHRRRAAQAGQARAQRAQRHRLTPPHHQHHQLAAPALSQGHEPGLPVRSNATESEGSIALAALWCVRSG